MTATSRQSVGSDRADQDQANGPVGLVRLLDIRPSPENDRLYRPVDPDDPDIRSLADSIDRHGLVEPLVVTADGYILSGHRRHTAARLAGLEAVPARTVTMRRTDDPNRFLALLREYNRQREKSFDERMREEVVSIDPHDAYQELLRHRAEESDLSGFRGERVDAGAARRRKGISRAKRPMLDAVMQILDEYCAYLPISLRQIHYALLNDPPLRHANKPGSTYANDRRSANDLSDLVTRARLDGEIDIDAICDETRPVIQWRTYPTPGQFVAHELGALFKGYHRDLQRSQPCHIEMLCEKLALGPIIKPIAGRYGIPLTLGRGYSSIPPRRDMAERFEISGKDKCVLLVLADFDPEGITIGESFTRSMRDEFDMHHIEAIRVALNRDQAEHYELPESVEAKKSSSNYQRFVERYGPYVWELEAIDPDELQEIVQAGIESVMDMELYGRELAQEKRDAAHLKAARLTVQEALSGLDFGEAHTGT